MAREEKSFEDLVKEAPAAPAAEIASLVGTLAQSSEPGKFVLTLQDGRPVTLETASVKGHTVLGTSVGRTIVRVDVDAANMPAGAVAPSFTDPNINKPPFLDHTLAWRDHPKPIWEEKPSWLDQPWAPDPYPLSGGPVQAGRTAPFSLATAHQAPPGALAALQGASNVGVFTGYIDVHTGYFDVHTGVADVTGVGDHKVPIRDGATGAWPWYD